MDEAGKVTHTATLTKADVDTEGTIREGFEGYVVTAGGAKAISEKAIATALAATGEDTLGGKIAKAQSAAEDAQGTADEALGKANTALQTASGDDYVSAVKDGTEVKVTTNIGAITEHVDAELVKEGTAVATAISDAESNAIAAAKALELNATGKSSETDAQVTVTLGGTVEVPTLTVTTSDIASAQALANLETKVDNFHKAGVSYKVLESLPAASAEYNGVVVLVPASTEDDPTAVAGDYVEHLCVNKGTENAPVWDWERIGTTKADLTQYAKSDDEITATGKSSETDPQVTVTLGGTVGAPTLTVATSDIASAATLAEVKGVAETAVQSASGDTYVSAVKDGTEIKVTTNISTIDSKLAEEASVVGGKIKTVETNAAQALADAKTELNAKITGVSETVADLETSLETSREEIIQTVDAKSLAATSTGGTYVTVNTAGTVGEGLSVTVDDTALTTTVNKASSAIQGIKVNNGTTLTKDANNIVNIPVATHSNGTWTNSGNLVTGSTVSGAISTAKTQVLGTSITSTTAKDDATYPKVTVGLSGTVQNPKLTVTTDDIASATALSMVS
jgi:hypothetical protein